MTEKTPGWIDERHERLGPNVEVEVEEDTDDRVPGRARRVPQEGEADTAGEHGPMAPEAARGLEHEPKGRPRSRFARWLRRKD